MAAASYSPMMLALSLLLLLSFSSIAQAYTRSGTLRPSDCKAKCTYRCSATSHKKPCMFFCEKCCAKCLCVPPGTYGNKQVCPCYNNWKTKEGGPKCP
ncbi:protein RSI-1-like isoform X2 [Vigna radiata var. radiata]|uniref:Protein RSI-1-like isoform X1 n=1 Tax=Vigna radiata var. radiata TaxID=3916 RepID=A0A1S3UDX9_VIGRR|nr:protein RSI-1-like isoform X1 [Vigna radiata var. radiata]XP_014504170.2 protein RSI-1-like isoform X2 [Vigna radiata var. radiata]XP_014504233.1 protein RSI-1-like isoform X1 [Vigna radiata var. radiata]XP_014504234.2 protein RSI-1-like isoform X2 [Vigna radiata var. radiata]